RKGGRILSRIDPARTGAHDRRPGRDARPGRRSRSPQRCRGQQGGQAIPAKWRPKDANGVQITDPASFAGLYAYPLSCDGLQGNILDSVEEYASGSSGLLITEDG